MSEKKLLIIADAGGNKTAWSVTVFPSNKTFYLETEGINATTSIDEEIEKSVKKLFLTIIEKELEDSSITVYFYGAGVNSLTSGTRIRSCFEQIFGNKITQIEIYSDIEGAARSMFGNEPGLTCILGTGSASGLYNGSLIIDSVPSLGYVLGDEGSGAFMGKMLITSYFKRDFKDTKTDWYKELSTISVKEVLMKIYQDKSPAKFLSSFVPFLKKYENESEIKQIIEESLKLFFINNVLKYSPMPCKIGFAGSVATVFKKSIMNISKYYGFNETLFLQKPIEKLTSFHLKKIETDL